MQCKLLRSEADGPCIRTAEGILKLQVVDDAIVRVVVGSEPLTEPATDSPMIVEQSGDADWSLAETESTISLETAALRVDLEKDTGALTYRDADGDRLVREPSDGGRRLDPVDVEAMAGENAASPHDTLDREAYATTLELEFSDDEAIYGLGQHDDGIANYRGHDQHLYQHNTKVAMPVFVSTQGYGLLFDSYSLSTFHDDRHGTYFWSECVDELDFYVVYGPAFDEIVSGFRQLTGTAAMLPKWSYGYVQSKERYKSQDELLEVVDEYRDREIPIDCIVQDWQYWPDSTDDDPDFEEWGGPGGDWGQWGQKSFEPERFPDPDALTENLHERNVRLMISIWPNMITGENYEEMAEAGHLLDDGDLSAPDNEVNYYDVFDEDARELYWKQADEGLFSHGVDAWWADSTEPYNPDWGLERPLEPAQRLALITGDYKQVFDPAYINAYSLYQAKGLYEGQRSTTEDKRVLNLTRSGYPGQQRYGAITWSGDIEATWDRLEKQLADGLQFTATGNPKWTLDIGAFFVEDNTDEEFYANGDFNDGYEDLGYRELYTRWFQFGTFLPLFRSHGTNTPREMWRFGEPGDRFYETLVKFDELRYRLLPYIYSLAGWETHRDYTMFRHLAFDFREDERVHDIADQFMFGPSLLVCPVTEPMYYGPDSTPLEGRAKAREVYLPEGTEWYDFWTGERYEGGQTIIADAPLEKLPLFVRAGSVLPMGPVVQHTEERPDAPWHVRVYPGHDGSFDVYEDAGDGYDYEDGAYAVTPLEWDDGASELAVREREGSFPELVETRDLHVVVVDGGQGRGIGVDEHEPQATVTYDGTETSVTIDR
ncbi:glycoside hydrolase family 31 protein [Halopiger xanaduensis]|uniref:Glycoside hydrolase family 31 n=1 Tax=Halopiger xanaduensis (strain DSM 18323 / JCM 14033 / SH-6) TaxID=797210 RepID=F8DD73_HALXS|nr:TIM-barrel domain-containing protein [Halopiger xanaduensis]AEH38962.1 glycoside hydrolase family 31 [Halopiger xanaduensis SH-6]